MLTWFPLIAAVLIVLWAVHYEYRIMEVERHLQHLELEVICLAEEDERDEPLCFSSEPGPVPSPPARP